MAPARPVAGGTTTTRLTAGRAAVQEFDTDVALGAWPGDGSAPSAYPGMLSYRDGSEATNGAGGAEGVYHPSKVLSVHDGVLDWWCRDAKAAAVLPFGYEGFTHGTYTVRMRTDDFAGYHIAFLLWPTSDRWSHELDGPEGETSDAHPYPAVLQGTDPVSFAPTQRVVTPASWHDPVMHDYTWQWGPGFVAFYQDGVQVTRVTTNVPDEPMRPVLQVEWSNSGERPDPAVSGHVYVDRISYDPRWTIPVA
ncbi:glycoside hydrolase family 16 protein [Modestobacter sp. SYSU DS0657]